MSNNRYPPLQSGLTYHILNQGNDGVNLFEEDRNYIYFLNKYRKYIGPIADTYAWCLMPNHFHLLLRVKDYAALHEAHPKRFAVPPPSVVAGTDLQTQEHVAFDEAVSKGLSRQFADFFSGYALAFNKAGTHGGKLFSLPFDRILVDDDGYFEWLITYIHRNPIHHRFCASFEDWPHSSYREITWAFLNNEPTGNLPICDIPFLLDWFGSYERFVQSHTESVQHLLDRKYRLED
jgi:putative transposase